MAVACWRWWHWPLCFWPLLSVGVQSQSVLPPQGLMALDLKLQRAVSAALPPMLQPLVRAWTLLGDCASWGC
jgi:undecaprenyl-diphosphatase